VVIATTVRETASYIPRLGSLVADICSLWITEDSYGCLAQDNGSGGVMTVIYQCSEIDSSEAGKKALVWKKFSTCKVTFDSYGQNTAHNICMKDGDKPACKAFA